ncbi:hypothetical protein HRbin36_01768 [bacterium HR36]|nr:hypothetical protein HRbin36_01768 [bacterium HR36]
MVAPAETLPLILEVRDPEVIEELSKFPDERERNLYALAALRIGILALRQARGDLDKQTIRAEADRLLSTLRERLESHQQSLAQQIESALKQYFDPQSGQLHQRIQRLIGQNGELEQFLRQYIGQQDSELCKTLAAHLGKDSPLMQYLSPEQRNGLLALVQELLETKLTEQREHVLRQFSLDNRDGALCRFLDELQKHQEQVAGDLQTKIAKVVDEFSLDRQDSALSRLVRNVEEAQKKIIEQFSLDKGDSALSRLRQELIDTLEKLRNAQQVFQEEVKKELAALQARRQEMQRSTQHGLQFEQALFEQLKQEPCLHGHLVEFVGNETGKTSRSKVGDIVIVLNNDHAAAGARIVIEAKEKRDYTQRKAIEELEQARQNREAQIGVFVFSGKYAPNNIRPLDRWDCDIITVWDAEDPSTDIYLRAAILLAQALCVRQAKQESAAAIEMRALGEAIEALQKSIQSLDKIEKSASTIRTQSEEILKEANKLRETIAKQLQTLQRCLEGWRSLCNFQNTRT